MYLLHISNGAFCIWVLTGLLLRAGGRGFPPATMNVAPGYFHWKKEEK